MNALILVDLQNDFLPGGALAVPGGDEVIPVANELMAQFDLVIATQDWHPANHTSFAANHPGASVGQIIDLHGIPQMLWPVHCVASTRGVEFAADLNTTEIHRVFRKGANPAIDSYSGLFDNNHRNSTGLGEFLKQQDITEVWVMGLATDYCVKFTALDAMAFGFNVHLIADGCRGVELKPGDIAAALTEMKSRGIQIVQSRDLNPHEMSVEASARKS